MTEPNDPQDPHDQEPPDPFPAFGGPSPFSPFPPMDAAPAAPPEPAPRADPDAHAGPEPTPEPEPELGPELQVAQALPASVVAAPAPVRPDPPSDWNQKADAHDLIARENRLKAMARFAFPPGPPPDDDGLAARDRRWTTRTLLVATLFLAVFNAVSVPNWSRQQAPGWITDTVRGVSEVWAAQVALLGADMPRQGVRDAYEQARDSEWVGQTRPDDRPRP